MKKHLVLDRSTMSAADIMASHTPEQGKAEMAAWMDWALLDTATRTSARRAARSRRSSSRRCPARNARDSDAPGRFRLHARAQVSGQPGRQLDSRDTAGCKIQHQSLLLVDRGLDRPAIQVENGRHRGMRDPLVAIEEWMIHREAMTERAGLSTRDGYRSTESNVALG